MTGLPSCPSSRLTRSCSRLSSASVCFCAPSARFSAASASACAFSASRAQPLGLLQRVAQLDVLCLQLLVGHLDLRVGLHRRRLGRLLRRLGALALELLGLHLGEALLGLRLGLVRRHRRLLGA